MIKQLGKRGKEWIKERARLRVIYRRKGIDSCEVRFKDCMGVFGMSFAHRHKRVWYYNRPGLLGSFEETVRACAHCHDKMERDKGLTAEVFKRLR